MKKRRYKVNQNSCCRRCRWLLNFVDNNGCDDSDVVSPPLYDFGNEMINYDNFTFRPSKDDPCPFFVLADSVMTDEELIAKHLREECESNENGHQGDEVTGICSWCGVNLSKICDERKYGHEMNDRGCCYYCGRSSHELGWTD